MLVETLVLVLAQSTPAYPEVPELPAGAPRRADAPPFTVQDAASPLLALLASQAAPAPAKVVAQSDAPKREPMISTTAPVIGAPGAAPSALEPELSGPKVADLEKRFELGLELVRLDSKIETFDTSSPAWSSWMRGFGYVLLPLGMLTAPYLPNNESALSSLVPETLRSFEQVKQPLGTMHTAGWATLGTAIGLLSVGIVVGVTTWVKNLLELDDLKTQRESLVAQYDAMGGLPGGQRLAKAE